MKYLVIFLCLFLACKNTQSAYADKSISLYIYNIQTSDSIDADDAAAMALWMKDRYIEGMGFDINFIYYEEVSYDANFYGLDLHSPDNLSQNYRLNAFELWLAKTKRGHKNALHYGIFPAMYCNNMKCFGGMARGGCNLIGGTVSIGQAAKWSSHTPPRARIPAGGGIVMAHECGHTMAMWHKSIEDGYPPNIMDQAAGRFVDSHPSLPFIRDSIEQFNSCVDMLRTQKLKRCTKKTKKARRRCVKRIERYLSLETLRNSHVLNAFS